MMLPKGQTELMNYNSNGRLEAIKFYVEDEEFYSVLKRELQETELVKT